MAIIMCSIYVAFRADGIVIESTREQLQAGGSELCRLCLAFTQGHSLQHYLIPAHVSTLQST